jgi:hypothetical protein
MKTLRNLADKEEILRRLNTVQPASQRRWGSMSAHNMICHLSDGFRLPRRIRCRHAGVARAHRALYATTT